MGHLCGSLGSFDLCPHVGLLPTPSHDSQQKHIGPSFGFRVERAEAQSTALGGRKATPHVGASQVEQLFALTPVDLAGNIDYKSLCYIITHGDEKEE